MGFFTSSKEKKKLALKAEFDAYVKIVEERHGIPVIASQVTLKAGEQAFLEDEVILKETRSVTTRSSSGGAFRVMKGVYVGGSSGTSRSHNEWQTIDKGRLVMTNQRIIFDGNSENRVVAIDKVISVSPALDGIEISIENKQKSSFYTVKNCLIWNMVFKIVHDTEVKKKEK